jgi:biopolymer transport protein ExbD
LSSRVAFAWKPSRANAARATKRRVSITPTVNVVGILSIFAALLFLMLGDTVPEHMLSVPVNIPVASNAIAQPGAAREDAIKIAVARDGHVFFGRTEIESRDISARIWESIRAGSEIKVYLSADRRAATRDVNGVIDEIHRAGVRDLVILANKRSD